MLLPIAFFHCGMTVLMCSALWVSFLAERHWERFSSSVLLIISIDFISTAILLRSLCHHTCTLSLLLQQPLVNTSQWGNRLYFALYVQHRIYSMLYGPEPKLGKVKAKVLLRTRYVKVVLDGELGTLSPLARKD